MWLKWRVGCPKSPLTNPSPSHRWVLGQLPDARVQLKMLVEERGGSKDGVGGSEENLAGRESLPGECEKSFCVIGRAVS